MVLLCLQAVSADNIDISNDNIVLTTDISVNQSTVIDKEVVISSTGSKIVADNCNVFNITENGKLTLKNLIISGGNTAIYNKGTLYLLNCTFTNNKGIDGGAIYNVGKLTVEDSTFSKNSMTHFGGAIYNVGDNVVIKNSKFISNTAKLKNGPLEGGAIYNQGKNLKVLNCYFEANGIANTDWYENAVLYGGAISNRGENILVRDSFFTKNYIYGSTDTTPWHLDLNVKYGASIATMATGTFINNTFDYNEIYAYLASYVVEKIDCSHRGYGPGIYVSATSKIINNTFINNRAGQAALQINANNCVIDSNFFLNNTVMHGSPAINVNGKNTIIINNIILRQNNLYELSAAAAIGIKNGENELIENNYFENCSGIDYYNVYHKFVPDEGNGHYDYDYIPANVVIRNNIFKSCSEAMYFDTGVNIKIEGNQFYNCHSGITAGNSKNISIVNNYFTGNYIDGDLSNGYSHDSAPSSIYVQGNDCLVKGNIFKDLSGEGSVVTVFNHDGKGNSVIGNFFVNNNIINNHTLNVDGKNYTNFGNALIESSSQQAEISDNYFGNNSLNGGSIFHFDAFYSQIKNNVFYANDATVFLFEDYYKYNDFTLKDNQFSDLKLLETGKVLNVKDGGITITDAFDTDGTVIYDVNNGRYDGDGSEFDKKLQDLLAFILNGLKKPSDSSTQTPTEIDSNNKQNSTSNSNADNKNPIKNPNNNEINNESGNNNSNSNLDKFPDFTGEDFAEVTSNKTSENSNVGDSFDDLVSSVEKVVSIIQSVENGAFVSKENIARSVGIESFENPTDQSKSYEINKNSVKTIDDDSMFLKVFIVIIVVLALIGVGYYRKR